jgi:DNA-binding winged helix-turn-helix (wHTH) protein
MLERLAERHNQPLDGAALRTILKETGGHPGLLRAAYRTATETRQELPRALRASARVQNECRRIWYSMPADEQKAIGDLAVMPDNPPTGPVRARLEDKGLIEELDLHKYALFSRLFGDCIVQLRLHRGPQIHVNRNLRTVDLGDKQIKNLAPLLFGLIDYLEQHRDRACSREELIRHLYPDEPEDGPTGAGADGRLDTVVTRLRRAIEVDPSHPRYILTVRGHGYRLGNGQAES